MFIPPTSGRKAVRLRNAASIVSLSKLYGSLMSAWISDSTDPKMKKAWMDSFRRKMMAASMELRTIQDLTDLAKWEGNIRGKWALKEYRELTDIQIEMTSSLAQVRRFKGAQAFGLTRLDSSLVERFFISTTNGEWPFFPTQVF